MAEQPEKTPKQPTPQPIVPVAQSEEEVVRHKSARRKRGLRPAKMQLTLTSMIDVIFQLLIYFVVTASFAIDEGVLTATLPKGTGQTKSEIKLPPNPVTILLASKDEIDVFISIQGQGQSFANFTELSGYLKGMMDRGLYKDDNPMYIQPNRDVRWQHVVNCLNATIKAGYSDVQFKRAKQ